jgi:uncharacterized membrane protein YgdD (TMEM256/DUF423 family)
MAKTVLTLAAISGLCAVALGAFGAHGLKARLTEDLMAVYQTGVQYHFYHTFALIALGLMLHQFPQVAVFKWSACLMVVGIAVFSGSLYILALTGVRWLGAITPIGGVAFIIAWFMMAVGTYQHFGR